MLCWESPRIQNTREGGAARPVGKGVLKMLVDETIRERFLPKRELVHASAGEAARSRARLKSRLLAEPGTPGILRAQYRVCVSAE